MSRTLLTSEAIPTPEDIQTLMREARIARSEAFRALGIALARHFAITPAALTQRGSQERTAVCEAC